MTEHEQRRLVRHRLAVLRHADEVTGNVAMTCRYYGISRPTFYKWRNRFDELGEDGLRDRSSRPHYSPNETDSEVVGKIMHLRQNYHFGPQKISMYLKRYHDIGVSPSGVWRILKRLGMNRLPTSQRYKRHAERWKRYEKPQPGLRVQIDVKFLGRMGDSRRKYYQDTAILFGGGDMSTPEGWYQAETFGMVAPIAVMVVTVAIGARALVGEEEHRTMGLLLANPIKRSTVVYQKTFAMVLYAFAVGFATFAGVAVVSLLGGLDMSIGNIAATSLLVTLVGRVFGAFALALSAATGRVKVGVYGAVGAALVLYVLNALLPFTDKLVGFAKWSPFYYYLSSDPLMNGMNWGHGAVLTGLTVVLIGLSVVLFQHRDLRQTA